MKRLDGKVALITGGNSGIGLASAKRLHEEGARVVITGRDAKTLDEAQSAIGTGTLAIQSDVSKLGDIDRLFSTVASSWVRSMCCSRTQVSRSSHPTPIRPRRFLTSCLRST